MSEAPVFTEADVAHLRALAARRPGRVDNDLQAAQDAREYRAIQERSLAGWYDQPTLAEQDRAFLSDLAKRLASVLERERGLRAAAQ